MTRYLVPLHKRIALLVRSRTKGLGGVLALMGVMAFLTLQTGEMPQDNNFAFWAMGILVSYIAVPFALSATSEELTGTEAALWLQKPVREVRFLLAGFAETLAASVGLSVLFGSAFIVIGMAMGWDPGRPPLLSLPVGALASLTIASMAFGTAAWLPRGSRAAVLFLIVMGVFLFDPEISQPELVRDGPVVLARFVLFPAPEVVRLGLGLTGDLPLRLQPVIQVLAYAAGWIGVGILGVRRSATKGRIGYS